MPVSQQLLQAAKILVEETKVPMTAEEYLAERRRLHELYMPDCKPLPGVTRLIQHLHKHNIPIAVATSSLKQAFDLKTSNKPELFSLFGDNIICGDSPRIKAGKPAPDIFFAAAEKLGVDLSKGAERCLVFEDAPVGAHAGLNAGMTTVWVPDANLKNRDEDLLKRCAEVLSSLEEFVPERYGLPPFDPNLPRPPSMQQELIIPFANLKHAKVEIAPLSPLEDGFIRLRIDRFSVTANNITYVALGKGYQYKDFFPTIHPDDTMKMPVWGLATVVESRHPNVLPGELLYGYYPAAAFYDMQPGDGVSQNVIRVKRDNLPADRAIYNEYIRCARDPLYHPKTTDAMIVFRPLWGTSFFLSDYLTCNNFFEADSVIITSASSKTSFCLAQLLSKLTAGSGKEIVGLTSPRNKEFCSRLGVYTRVVLYSDAGSLLENGRKAVIADMAGDAKVLNTIAGKRTSQLKAIITVGLSHFDPEGKDALPKLSPDLQAITKLFFAPGWVQTRMKELGSVELGRRMGEAWELLMGQVYKWMKFPVFEGPEAALRVYLDSLNGQASASEGYVVTFFPPSSKTKL
ncbi:hypothetical protein HDU67_009418 [Dinochytrium kinnereticum]|nr:hypothetical protein HDU67_009418 [Dinochytrium kinnereticum]